MVGIEDSFINLHSLPVNLYFGSRNGAEILPVAFNLSSGRGVKLTVTIKRKKCLFSQRKHCGALNYSCLLYCRLAQREKLACKSYAEFSNQGGSHKSTTDSAYKQLIVNI